MGGGNGLKELQDTIAFGPYRLDGPNALLLRDGVSISLAPKALDVLNYLAARPGRLVTKEELLAAIWPDVIVSDASIKVCIGEIRKALADEAKTPRFIETVHRRGYRFIAPLREDGTSENPREPEPAPPRTESPIAPPAMPIGSIHPMVGRDKELSCLFELLGNARSGQRQCLFLSGNAGSGKTRLVESFVRSVRQASGSEPAMVLFGHCFQQFGTSEPYLPLWEAIGRLARERPAAVLSRYTGGSAAGSTVGDSAPPIPMPPPGSSERLLHELVDSVEAAAERRLVLLVLEDIHWADYSTLDLISALARRHSPAQLLVLATYRPSEILTSEHPLRGIVQALATANLANEMSLCCLNEAAVEQFLAARFPSSKFPAALAQRLYQRTDGHPLFLVELVDDLVEQGVIVQRDGCWQLDGAIDAGCNCVEMAGWLAVLDTQVPKTVRDMIEVHLARIDADSRAVLEAAAVAGVEFSAAAVAYSLGHGVVKAERICDELVRRQRFLEQRGAMEWPDGTVATHYRFAHELYHNVVYEQIPIARRIQFHAQIGLRLEQAWGERALEEAALLASHFETGRDWPRAVKYFRQAAHAAGCQYAHREATYYLRRALSAVERLDAPERAAHELDVLKSLGMHLQLTRGYAAPEVESIHARAYALCWAEAVQGVDHVNRRFPVVWSIWLFHKVRSALNRARTMAQELLSLADQNPQLLLQAHQAICVTHLCLGEPRVTVEHMERAMALYDSSQHSGNTRLFGQDPGVSTLAFGAVALWLMGQEELALQRSEQSLELARRLNQPSSLALALHFAAMLHQLRGDTPATGQYASEAIDIATEGSFCFWLAGGTILRGWARAADSGAEFADRETAIADIRRGLEAWLATGSQTYHTYFLGLLADALQRLNRPQEALPLLEEGIAAATSLPEGLYHAELHRLKGGCLLQMSQKQDARIALLQAVNIAHAQGAVWLESKAQADLEALQQLIDPMHQQAPRPRGLRSGGRMVAAP